LRVFSPKNFHILKMKFIKIFLLTLFLLLCNQLYELDIYDGISFMSLNSPNMSNSTYDVNVGSICSIPKSCNLSLLSARNDLPNRLQWNENNGYCGEVSFIIAGLYYGQYISQYDARAIASQNGSQNLASSQLLLGINDAYAAKAMHLKTTSWTNSNNTNSFLTWVKSQVVAENPVIIGLYTNENFFDNSSDLDAGETEYDHIVTVTGFSSYNSLSDTMTYYPNDIIEFSDNGLWTGTSSTPQYNFISNVNIIQGNRQQANSPNGSIYTLSNNTQNYGIAITGIIDESNETLPVRISTNQNFESPEIIDGSTIRPSSTRITLTITVSNLTPGTKYILYRYNKMESVPNSSINSAALQAFQAWPVSITSGSTFKMSQVINSNEIAVYRAVPVSAP